VRRGAVGYIQDHPLPNEEGRETSRSTERELEKTKETPCTEEHSTPRTPPIKEFIASDSAGAPHAESRDERKQEGAARWEKRGKG